MLNDYFDDSFQHTMVISMTSGHYDDRHNSINYLPTSMTVINLFCSCYK